MIYRKNKKVGILSFVYCISTILFLMLSLSLITSSNGYKVETWQDYATFDFEQETMVDDNGEEVVTNLISTPEQLAGFFAMQSEENVHADDHTTYFKASSYKLAGNIDLSGRSWSPKNNSNTLDGMSFTIKNLTISNNGNYIGLVAINYGTIKNLYFENVNVTNSKTDGAASGTGAVCGYNSGTIDNVTVLSGTIKGNTYSNNNDRRVGGICGYNKGTITECTNRASVQTGKFLGGIAGVSNGKITNCYNYGSISYPYDNTYPRLGGIVGENESSATLTLCLNWGSVDGYFSTSSKKADISDIRIGGIVGHSSVAVSECGNYGSVSGGYFYASGYGSCYANAAYVGGVVGYCTKGVSYCYNKGYVTGYATQKTSAKTEYSTLGSTAKQFASGVGYFWAYTLYITSGTYTDSKGAGKYKTSTYKSYYYYTYYDNYVAGVAGKCDSTVTSCYNKGTVSGNRTEKVKYYDLYFKWKANSEYRLLIHQDIHYTESYSCANICSSGSTNYSYYSSDVKISKSRSFSASQTYTGDKGTVRTGMYLYSWTKNSAPLNMDQAKNSSWYVHKGFDGADFNTYHNIDARGISNIKLSAQYYSEYIKDKSEVTYYTIYTGFSSTTFTSNGTEGISTYGLNQWNSVSKFAQDSNINGGDPYLKGLYW